MKKKYYSPAYFERQTVFILCVNIYFLKGFFSFSLLFTALVTRRRATPMAPSVAAPVRHKTFEWGNDKTLVVIRTDCEILFEPVVV